MARSFSQVLKLTSALLITLLASSTAFCDPTPLSVPDVVKVISSHPRVGVWNTLSGKEKKLATHLIAAANASKPLLFFQNHRHGLVIHEMLKHSLSAENIKSTRAFLGDSFQEYLNYSVLFEDFFGPFGISNRKHLLKKVTPEQVNGLLDYTKGISPQVREEIIKLLTDPGYEVLQFSEYPDGTGLETCGGNIYEKGITAQELNVALKAGLKPDLNTRIVRGKDGKLKLEVQALNNPNLNPAIRLALKNVIQELRRALPYTATQNQKNQITSTIKFFEKGNIEDFRQANIAWVKDGTTSRVDFMMGWVEIYQDHNGKVATWESYIQIVDPKITQDSLRLAKSAQYFEDKMPYGKFKKTFPANWAPPAMMAYLLHEVSLGSVSGYNLPNFDDIRISVGAKNVIVLKFPAEGDESFSLSLRPTNIHEFSPASVAEEIVADYGQARNVMVTLHEIIGHGSGTYDQTKYEAGKDPISELGSLGSALEEQRADLTAMVFVNDPKLVELGLYKTQAEADHIQKVLYNGYMTEFLVGTAKEENFNESHSRGNLLFINRLIKSGAVSLTAKDGSPQWTPENVVFTVNDLKAFQAVAVETLRDLQDIKANRNEERLKTIFAEDANLDDINTPWAQGILARGKKVKVDSKMVWQPWEIKRKTLRPLGDTSLESYADHVNPSCNTELGRIQLK